MSEVRLNAVVCGPGNAESDVPTTIVLPAGDDRVADLVVALGGGPGDCLCVEGRWISGETPIAAAAIRRGDRLAVGNAVGPAEQVAASSSDEGAAAALEVRVIAGLQAGARAPLADRPLVIGRDPRADVVVEDPTVSARHARLSVQGSETRIEDLRARNGVKIDGDFVSVPSTLPLGSVADLGASQVMVAPVPATDPALLGRP